MTTYRNYETAELLAMDAELDYYDPELVEEICDRAGMSEEIEASDEDTFERVIYRALEILGL